MTAGQRLEAIALVLFGFFAMGAYYNFVVAPSDELRYQIIECMQENTEEEYSRCRKEIVQQANK